MDNKIVYYLVVALFMILTFSFLNIYKSSTPLTGFSTASEQAGNLSAGVDTYLACTWASEALAVSFGTGLVPGTADINATDDYSGGGGGTKYKVTSSALSTVNVNVTVKGANLIDGIKTIGVGNATWASNDTSSTGANMIPGSSIALQTIYDTTNKVGANEIPGTQVWYRFWLDVPAGQVSGSYVGNYTMECSEA